MLSRFRLNVSRCRKTILPFASLTVLILLFNLPAFAAAGDLDLSFGQNGITHAPGGGFSSALSIVVQPDGKIIAGGRTSSSLLALVRYLPDGQIDSSFGSDGRVTTSFAEYSGFNSYLNDVVVLPDGKIVAAGEYWRPNPFGIAYRINLFVIRYNSDGSIDTTFMNNGRYIVDSGGLAVSAQAIAVQPDGKFLVTGYAGGTFDGNVPYKSLLFRFSGNGLDAAFGDGGIVVTSVPGSVLGNIQSYSIALQTEGKILVGSVMNVDSKRGMRLSRYNTDGNLDASFGENGSVFVPDRNLEQAVEILVQKNGKIVAVSSTYTENANITDFALLRFNPNGAPDTGFGTNGTVVTAVTNFGDVPTAGALQDNGKIIVAGYTSSYQNPVTPYTLELARYNSNGSLDGTFGIGGIVRTPAQFPLGDAVIQNEGKILAVCNGYGDAANGFRVLRFLANGTREFDFDNDRKADLAIFRPGAAEWYWLGSTTNQSSGVQFGISSDKIVPADYDGDGKTDIAVFRDGDWYRLNSSDNQFAAFHFGQTGDLPVPADFDNDGKADLAVYRQGSWYILNSSDNSFRADQFGISSDKPVIGDFDSDGKTDLAVYRQGVWYEMRSSQGFYAEQFGISSDKPVAADYDGDGKTDLAVYRPSDGTWYLLRSHLGFTATQFGISTDKPTPADYDGDGKADIAVYRDGNWYLQQSTAGFRTVQFGASTDVPVASAFSP